MDVSTSLCLIACIATVWYVENERRLELEKIMDFICNIDARRRKRNTELSNLLLSSLGNESTLDKILKHGLDDDFLGLFMVDRSGFLELLQHFEVEYKKRAIRRRDKRKRDEGFVLLGRRVFDAKQTLAMTLRYMVGGICTRTRQLEFNGKRRTIDRYLNFGIECLMYALDRTVVGRVELPTLEQMNTLASAVKRRCEAKGITSVKLHHVWGFIDGTMHRSSRPTNHDTQKKFYNGYYGVCGYKALYLVGSDGAILWAKLSRGTEYDNNLYSSLYIKLFDMIPSHSKLAILGDSAFTPSRIMLRPYTEREKVSHTDRIDEILR